VIKVIAQKRLTALLLTMLLGLIILSGCGREETKTKTQPGAKSQNPPSEMSVWGLTRLRASGLDQTLFAEFSKKYNCKINLHLFDTLPDLLDSLAHIDSTQTGSCDLIMNLDSSFTSNEETRALFSPLPEISTLQLSRDLILDPQKRLIPYGYANLGVIFNTRQFPKGPESFGELQDARYFRQLGICDPKTSGVGRSTLYWSLALFGARGYEYLWKSVRKNVQEVYSDYESGLAALKNGKISMLIGYNTTPAWLEESQQTDKSFQYSMLKEGAWQYSELAGVPLRSTRPAMAAAFIKYLTEPEAQLMIIYKLGLFPANSKTMLPIRFARIPISSFVVNRRLSEAQIQAGLPVWLEFWDELFSNRYPAFD